MPKDSPVNRDHAMKARPFQLPDKGREQKGEKLYVTVTLQRPFWQRLLGANEMVDRSFGLDPYGREVYEACNGKRSVEVIIKNFAKNHQINIAEAETSVTQFLQTLMSKGLVAMEIDK